MADVKISALPASTTPLAGTEVLPIVQSGVTKKVAVSDLTAGRAVSAASLALTTTPLPVGSGGTGLTSLTANYIPYGNATSAFANSANLQFNGTNLLLNTNAVLQSNMHSFVGASATGGQLAVRNSSSTAGKYFVIGATPDATPFFIIQNEGGVGVYLAPGGSTWVPATSDKRLKNKVADVTSALDAINKLNPVSFYYKNQPQTGAPQYGHFAQDVGAAIPDAMVVSPQVDPTLGEVYSYDPNVINVYLIAAVKELSAKFDAYVASHP
jgi:hypothetical protein